MPEPREAILRRQRETRARLLVAPQPSGDLPASPAITELLDRTRVGDVFQVLRTPGALLEAHLLFDGRHGDDDPAHLDPQCAIERAIERASGEHQLV